MFAKDTILVEIDENSLIVGKRSNFNLLRKEIVSYTPPYVLDTGMYQIPWVR